MKLKPLERALYEVMSEISETAYCAGWMHHCEHDIWDMVQGERIQWGMSTADELADQLTACRVLAELADVWIAWEGEGRDSGPVPIPLSRWRAEHPPQPPDLETE